MYWVLLLAAGSILGGVVVVAMGRGGELAYFSRDLPEAVMRFSSPADVVSVRLPLAPFGYQAQATGDALTAAARLVAERDAEIALLRRELRRLDPDDPQDPVGSVAAGADTGQDDGLGADPQQRQP
ncbi:MAG TPA: hypothetical protein VMR14_06545 [Streptosporangiaceae bacterium]|nr:hypothetical protein [Streptosporangiaceae bacterium]